MPKKYAEIVDKKIQLAAEKFAAEAGDITVITTPEKEVEAWRAKTADKLKADWLEVANKRTKNADAMFQQRSEEHTSELQSLMRISYAVFCLKKKKNKNEKQIETHLKAQKH